MDKPEQWAVAYIVAAIITAIILGATQKEKPEGSEAVFFWFLSAIWPFVWALAIVTGIASGPFWLGHRIRKRILAALKDKP